MGTNFYWNDPVREAIDDQSAEGHVGKRSAAGKYCWDCDVTLCKQGNDGIHNSRSDWHDACPQCGMVFSQPQGLTNGAVGVELGFASPNTERPLGVGTTSSFRWAWNPEDVGPICERFKHDPAVVNEYGDSMTGQEFVEMLRQNCPVQYTDTIGHWFS